MGLLQNAVFLAFIVSATAQYFTRDRGFYEPQRGNFSLRVGDLLVGRANRLRASSTCGTRKPERFCIVSHLSDNNDRTHCFVCDSRPYGNRSMSHTIDNIANIHDKTWWQSENGVENVNIQLDMEAEFHFTHLVITFKSFFPEAMLIEKSHDFGKTWKVYQYYAYDCAKAFPGVSTEHRYLGDVVCERYSSESTSHGGDVVFRAILPGTPIPDYLFSERVQDHFRMTNLRINFTKLHTLGDNLLDQGIQTQEKYYYAIKSMTVRGSCSCYGHASRCIPSDNLVAPYYDPYMIHGTCDCLNNTKRPNCKECLDFYNDLPWKAGAGNCKKCNCNEHATACKFDNDVYLRSGNISGGVCLDCQHNTEGINCEKCKPYFYHEPNYDIRQDYACQPCDCDLRGTIDDGLCDAFTDVDLKMQSGQCHCKENLSGRRCDRCKEGFWNYDENNPAGCEACSCNLHGTLENLGCDVITGECICKKNVEGRDCNNCKLQYWGLSEEYDGCKPCNCDPGGAYDNDCDVITGQCRCRPHVKGRACDQPEPKYFTAYPDYMVYEAELAKPSSDVKIQIVEPFGDGREVMWTGTGYARVYEGSTLEFIINNVPTPLKYDIVIRYAPQLPQGWDRLNVRLEHLDPVDANSTCANEPIGLDSDVQLQATLRSATVYPSVCLEPGKSYKVTLTFHKYDPTNDVVSASVLIDSIVLFPSIEALPILKLDRQEEFQRYRCGQIFLQPGHGQLPKVCQELLVSIGAYVNQGAYSCNCDATGSKSFECSPLGGQCECKPNVVGRRCDMCAPGTYGFGPEGCLACDCNSLALDNICDPVNGQCRCRKNTYGRQCNECQPGFWNFPNCQRCDCNGHASSCNEDTGVCENCLDHTTGDHCDRCIQGYYGAPQFGYDIPCRSCQCPGSIEAGLAHASRCSLDLQTQDMLCECDIGYAGVRCDVCDDNYYENEEGHCVPCECNNNVDIARPGNCDPKSGKCLQCLYNTEGDHCEKCKERYFGDAIHQQCTECVCELLGVNQTQEYCNRTTGQCPCLPNVIGLSCDDCAEFHWKIASGSGCVPCDCDDIGSDSKQCNLFTGQCSCKPGFGGLQCNQCQADHWGDPNVQCTRCDCENYGIATTQCNLNNGSCVCRDGFGGHRCDACARGYLGTAPECSFCGECFKNWDDILTKLHAETLELVNFAANIKQVGVSGAYTTQFSDMEKQIKEVEELLNSTVVSAKAQKEIEEKISSLKIVADSVKENVLKSVEQWEATHANVTRTDLALKDLNSQREELLKAADKVKEQATRLQEANVEGALNLTRKARKDSLDAVNTATALVENNLINSERQCKRATALYSKMKQNITNELKVNEDVIDEIKKKVDELNDSIPALNEKVCGKLSHCDATCGGAGCGSCGGISCDIGAATKANVSLDLVNRADAAVKEKGNKVDELLRSVTQAKSEVLQAKTASQQAFNQAEAAKNLFSASLNRSVEFSNKLNRFMSTAGAKPSEIRSLAEDVRKLKIDREQDEVKGLAARILTAANNLTNIENILEETERKKEQARSIQWKANITKTDAEKILNTVQEVGLALEEAAKAQSKADEAIQKASKDIATAEKDLTQISSESGEAQGKANTTLEEVTRLNIRLTDLNTQFTKNKLSADEIQKEVDSISTESNRTLQEVIKLKMNFSEAERVVAYRAGRSKNAKEKAEALSKRASQFYVSTENKEKDLRDLERSYREKDNELKLLSDEMEQLSRKMNEHIALISARSKFYSDCTVTP